MNALAKKSLGKMAAALALVSACASSEKKSDAAPVATVATANDPGAKAAPLEAPPLAGEEVLAAQPSLAPLSDFAAPVPTLTTLPNGLRIYFLDRPGAALETLAFVVKRGATADPPGHAGLASLAAAMLEAGAGGKSQAEMAAAADAIGASLHASAATDATFVAVSGMVQHTQEMVPLLADVALRPNLAEAEFAKVQGQRVAELQASLAEPRVAAGLAFAAALYGNSPLGHPALGTPATVQASSLADVKSFVASFDPRESALIVVGSAPGAALLAQLGQQFGSWTQAKPSALKQGARRLAANEPHVKRGPKAMHEPVVALASKPLDGLPASERPRLVFVDFKGRPQTVVRVGMPAVPRRSPDVLALRLLNSVLGGSFTSRLNQNLRELHSYTYGAGSNFAFGRGPGPFAALSSVKTADTGKALAEMFKELDRAVEEPLSDAELQKGKALLAYQMVETLQHSDGTAAALAEIFIDELPLDEYATFVPRLRAITAADVLAAAQRTLKPAEMTVALAGDEEVVLPQLAAAGLSLPAPEQRDALGEKIAAAEKK